MHVDLHGKRRGSNSFMNCSLQVHSELGSSEGFGALTSKNVKYDFLPCLNKNNFVMTDLKMHISTSVWGAQHPNAAQMPVGQSLEAFNNVSACSPDELNHLLRVQFELRFFQLRQPVEIGIGRWDCCRMSTFVSLNLSGTTRKNLVFSPLAVLSPDNQLFINTGLVQYSEHGLPYGTQCLVAELDKVLVGELNEWISRYLSTSQKCRDTKCWVLQKFGIKVSGIQISSEYKITKMEQVWSGNCHKICSRSLLKCSPFSCLNLAIKNYFLI